MHIITLPNNYERLEDEDGKVTVKLGPEDTGINILQAEDELPYKFWERD